MTPVLDISHRKSSKNTLKQIAKIFLKRKESKETCHVNNPNARSNQNLQTQKCFKNKPEQVIDASTQTHIYAFDPQHVSLCTAYFCNVQTQGGGGS